MRNVDIDKIIRKTVGKVLFEMAGHSDEVSDVSEMIFDSIVNIYEDMKENDEHKSVSVSSGIDYWNIRFVSSCIESVIRNEIKLDSMYRDRYYVIFKDFNVFGSVLLVCSVIFDTDYIANDADGGGIEENHLKQYESIMKKVSGNPGVFLRSRSLDMPVMILYMGNENDISEQKDDVISYIEHELMHMYQSDKNKSDDINDGVKALDYVHQAMCKRRLNLICNSVQMMCYYSLPYERDAFIHQMAVEMQNMADNECMDYIDDVDEFDEDAIMSEFRSNKIYRNITGYYKICMGFLNDGDPYEKLIDLVKPYVSVGHDRYAVNLELFAKTFFEESAKTLKKIKRCWYIHAKKWMDVLRQRYSDIYE